MQPDGVPEMTPEMEAVLRRYLRIQEEERTLQDEKKKLQAQIKQALSGMRQRVWFTEVDDTALKVVHSTTERITYDDDVLRQRLGERIRAVLRPDIRKIRGSLNQVESLLEPALDIVGSVDRGKVKQAVEQGLVHPEEFSGAFTRETISRVAVMRQRPADPSDTAAGANSQPQA